MQQFTYFLSSNTLVCNREKHLAFSDHVFAQHPVIWYLRMTRKGYKAAVSKRSPLSKTLQRKGRRHRENIRGSQVWTVWKLEWGCDHNGGVVFPRKPELSVDLRGRAFSTI